MSDVLTALGAGLCAGCATFTILLALGLTPPAPPPPPPPVIWKGECWPAHVIHVNGTAPHCAPEPMRDT